MMQVSFEVVSFTMQKPCMKNKDITVQPYYKMVKLITIILLLYVIIFYTSGR